MQRAYLSWDLCIVFCHSKIIKQNSLEVHRFSRKVIHRSFLGNNEDRAKNHYNNILILSKIFGPPVLGFFAEPIENILSRGSLPLAGSSTGL